MSVNTRSQRLAQTAYTCVAARQPGKDFDEYDTVARKFPALIHTCGLAQAVAFAQAKRGAQLPEGGAECRYLADLASVLRAGGHAEMGSADALARHCRNDTVNAYLRLSRDAIEAAVWIKRYAEALGQTPSPMVEAKP